MDRRRFLRLAGVAAAAGVAGCGEDGPSDGSNSGQPSPGSPSPEVRTPTSPAPEIDHPAAADLAVQPARGEFTGKLIVAFEDPSCPTCKRFHEQVYPELESNLIEPGRIAYVLRPYPVIYPWGNPACKALDATFKRDASAGWGLLDHYFTRQGSFGSDNVLEKTADYLDSQTAVDGAAVLDAVESGASDAAVQADLDAGRDAGLGSRTPVFALFRDGEFLTSPAGAVSYNTLATVLGER